MAEEVGRAEGLEIVLWPMAFGSALRVSNGISSPLPSSLSISTNYIWIGISLNLARSGSKRTLFTCDPAEKVGRLAAASSLSRPPSTSWAFKGRD